MLQQLQEISDARKDRMDASGDPELIKVFVSPMTDRRDDRFTYVVFETFVSHLPMVEGVIYLFTEERIKQLEILARFQADFGVQALDLRDVPGADYSVGYDFATTDLVRISLTDVISRSEVSAEEQANAILENATRHDREQAFAPRATRRAILEANQPGEKANSTLEGPAASAAEVADSLPSDGDLE